MPVCQLILLYILRENVYKKAANCLCDLGINLEVSSHVSPNLCFTLLSRNIRSTSFLLYIFSILYYVYIAKKRNNIRPGSFRGTVIFNAASEGGICAVRISTGFFLFSFLCMRYVLQYIYIKDGLSHMCNLTSTQPHFFNAL